MNSCFDKPLTVKLSAKCFLILSQGISAYHHKVSSLPDEECHRFPTKGVVAYRRVNDIAIDWGNSSFGHDQ